jgi:hypothetical protein
VGGELLGLIEWLAEGLDEGDVVGDFDGNLEGLLDGLANGDFEGEAKGDALGLVEGLDELIVITHSELQELPPFPLSWPSSHSSPKLIIPFPHSEVPRVTPSTVVTDPSPLTGIACILYEVPEERSPMLKVVTSGGMYVFVIL